MINKGKTLLRLLALAFAGILAFTTFNNDLNGSLIEFLNNNWRIGWLSSFILTLILIVIIERLPEQSLSNSSLEKDLKLLNERLQGFEANSAFMNFLTNEVLFSEFPSNYVNQMEDAVDKWRADARLINDRKLNKSFEKVKDAMWQFVSTVLTEMYSKEKKINGVLNYDYLEIPREWVHKDPERYAKASSDLKTDLESLSEALRDLHKLTHKKHSK